MAGTKDGRIDVFDYTGNYLDSLENAHEVMQGSEENPIFSICSLKDGFALTGRNIVTIYKFNSLVSVDINNASLSELNNKTMFSSNQYKIFKQLKLTKDDTVNITDLIKNSTEDELVCCTSSNQLFFIDLYKCEESLMVNFNEKNLYK